MNLKRSVVVIQTVQGYFGGLLEGKDPRLAWELTEVRQMLERMDNPPKPRRPLSTFRLPNLRSIRIKALLSQAALAKKAGLTQLTISKVEHTGIRARFGTINKLAAALGVKPEELMGVEGGDDGS